MSLPFSISEARSKTSGLPTELIQQASEAHPKPAEFKFTYGTAGIRTKADTLDSVCFRMGLVAALRSKSLAGKTVGIMVTASHNPEPDNGMKMVDPRGEMLQSSWESLCSTIANVPDTTALLNSLQDIISHASIDLSQPAAVVIGYDTRPSSPALVQALVDGLSAMGAKVTDAGLVTTPVLHYLVRAINTQGTPESYGEPTEEGYYKKLSAAYVTLVSQLSTSVTPLVVDCANGVGAPALVSLLKQLPSEHFRAEALRTSTTTPGALNNGCGADYVKTNQALPKDLASEGLVSSASSGLRLCSFDGDADRIVYYYLSGPPSDPSSFHLLDGDKIAALATEVISSLVQEASLQDKIKVGCVQTAYANGSSTKYLEARVPVTCTPTGVKYLHHAAESYDVGVYFEANGHGTVLFSPTALSTIHSAQSSPAADSLRALTDLINQTVGDALSDMLLVEYALRARGWTCETWDKLYAELPNALAKVIVKDRTAFKTTDAERKLVEPVGLQDSIDSLVKQVKGGRSFVRPSGTEDCVRVYAEAESREDMEKLLKDVGKLVSDSA